MAAKKSAKPAPATPSSKPAKKADAVKKVSSAKVKSPAAKPASPKKASPAKNAKAAKPATSLKEKKAEAISKAPAEPRASKKKAAAPAKPTKKLPATPATPTKKPRRSKRDVIETPVVETVETPIVPEKVAPMKAAPATSVKESKAAPATRTPEKSEKVVSTGKKASSPAPNHNAWNISQVKDEFIKAQYYRLLDLRDSLQDSMADVTNNNIRNRAEGSEASAFGMHQADAGSDAYDRDFALSLLSQEQNSLYDIMEALRRIENGSYGICEGTNKPIPRERLEAIPFARFTVEYQEIHEKENRVGVQRRQTRSLFGLDRDENSEDEDGSDDDSLDKNN